MAQSSGRSVCCICNKVKATFRCGGCLQEFCFTHLEGHKRELNKQYDIIEGERDLFLQTLNEQAGKLGHHELIQQIDAWESDAIRKIQEKAEESRRLVIEYMTGSIQQIERKLNTFTNQLKTFRGEDDFSETDLCRWNDELSQLRKELLHPADITIRQDIQPFLSAISISIASLPSEISPSVRISEHSNWSKYGVTVAGGFGRGKELNQFSNPWGLCVDDDCTVYVADYSGNRVIQWSSGSTTGQIFANGEIAKPNGTLYSPTAVIIDKKNDCLFISDFGNRRVLRWSRRRNDKGEIIISNVGCWGLAMDHYGFLYVADFSNYEVRRWKLGDTNGVVVAGGNGSGDRRNQLSGRFYIVVDKEQSVYVSDEDNHRVMKWEKGAQEGILVAGGTGKGSNLNQLSSPSGIAVDELGTVYIADAGNHRIVRWPKGAQQGNVIIGEDGKGAQANQLFSPLGIALDRRGNLYVVDNGNFRVQRFDIDSSSND